MVEKMENEENENPSDDENVYEDDDREELVASGGMSAEEDAFMKGYNEKEESKEDEVL